MHEESRHDGGADLLVGTLRHRFVVIVACGLLGAAAGWLYASSRAPTYTSSASVLINPVEGSPYAPSVANADLTSLETEAQIVPSDAVVRLVAQRLPAG